MPFPHVAIRGFKVRREAGGIEERVASAIARKLLFDAAKTTSITRQLQCKSLILVERVGDQFLKADGRQQARGHTPREGRTETNDHRHTHPKGIARRRVRIYR